MTNICITCGQLKQTRSAVMMGNQNARKSSGGNVRSKDNLEGFEEGKAFFVNDLLKWLEDRGEPYVYVPDLEERIKLFL